MDFETKMAQASRISKAIAECQRLRLKVIFFGDKATNDALKTVIKALKADRAELVNH